MYQLLAKAAAAAPAATSQSTVQDVMAACGQSSVYLVGLGMIVGSLFTILVLLLLDFTRRGKESA